MRCEDLIRELARPTGAFSGDELSGHLAACQACSEWSRRAARFDQIWDETRPADPSPEALDTLWARASAELDALDSPATLKLARPRRRRWASAAFAVASAAAVLVAALALFRGDGGEPVKVAVGPTKVEAPKEPELLDLEVEPDVLTIVRLDREYRPTVEKLDLSAMYDSPTIPEGTLKDLADAAETMAPFAGVLASSK